MDESERSESLVESWLRSLKNRPTIAVLLILATIVTGVASFTESIDKLLTYFKTELINGETTKRSSEDIKLERSLIGTWRPLSKPVVPSGVVITAFYCTFLPNGVLNWGGSYKIDNHEFPIMVSGKWRIEDSVLHYEVESSNVPLVVKEGFSSTSKIDAVTSNKMTYIDSIDRKKKVATRID